ncbi:hypothetical protein JX266_010264 [Neoarthrinium moseri]|uniref:uncharacterized protein n=1 Tax=Neoarthrinium moseri TaxID=1658444 RepID=UPI001FDCEE2A|nr:uncharacterized protein JN550_009140 [Neoarthrinium moseri]KAI1843631.1 hypothetical protein JX266_010264 [Neoarthrinium moseri]KAI1864120.1 hypothetical protein JN550_009140 [Neoarthrinium moseri]
MSNYENEAPTGEFSDNSYVSRSGHKHEPLGVVSDQERIEDPIDGNTADSDRQLESDDKEAIDKSNIINDRTRHAKPQGGYREPGDEEGLPSDTGKSSTSV